jgi:cytochrome c biogenesis protein CcdA/thiol-disulfide isomerase/thioredoxin
MTVLLAFAFISGVITILSPCILPVLPIVLSGGISGGKTRPLGVLAGFVASFTIFTLTLSAIVQAIGIPADALRVVAVVIIVLFGLVMLVPWLRDRFEMLTARIASRGAGWRSRTPATAGPNAPGTAVTQASGFWSGFPMGLSLGLIWTPCVGPIMASVISLAFTQKIDGGAVFLTLAYTMGTSIPMLAVMLGGRTLLNRVPALTRNTANIQKGFGVLMILVGVAIGLGWDRQFQTAVLKAFPNYGTGLTAIEGTTPVQQALTARRRSAAASAGAGLMMSAVSGTTGNAAVTEFTGSTIDKEPHDGVLGSFGTAPRIVARGQWFNTEGGSLPLTMDGLRGKVVVVDFWTYSCVNCVRTLPYLKAWFDTYKDRGLVIIGVHTPEFEFEKNSSNVSRAIKDLGVDWPVVQDNDYTQWNAYGNQYWPAHYFIDAQGRVRYFHFGEGDYDVSERVIQALLKEAGESVGGIVSKPAPELTSRTPETYLGYSRSRGFATAVTLAPDTSVDYSPAHEPANGEWTLAGKWIIASDYIIPELSGTLELGFNATNVYIVIEPQGPGGRIDVSVDGHAPTDTPDVKGGAFKPAESRLYQLVGLKSPGEHLLRLKVTGKLRLFAFTFG